MAQPDKQKNARAAYKGSKKRLGQLQRQAWLENRMWLVLAIGVTSLAIYLALLWYYGTS